MTLLYIDLFCGAGGTSTGVNSARLNDKQCATVIACVNHDKNAIASHAANHPEAMHFTEDIRTLELSPLFQKVALMRNAQKEYFKTRDKSVLLKSKKLEREVDSFLAQANDINNEIIEREMNIGDEVWFMFDGKPLNGKIARISENTIKVEVIFKDGKEYLFSRDIKDFNLFPTKEELLKSL